MRDTLGDGLRYVMSYTVNSKIRSRPISRVLSWTAIRLRCTLPYTCSGLPGDNAGRAKSPYLALLRVGFTLPRRVATRAVRSYRTISPLPAPRGTSAVYFLWHFPWARTPQALPGTLPSGARTFLHLPAGMQRLSGRLLASSLANGGHADTHLSPPLNAGRRRPASSPPPIDKGGYAVPR